MNVNWSNELQALDRVAPSRDLWADALARAASRQPPARGRLRGLSRMWAWRRRTVVLATTALGIAGLAAAGVVAFGSGSARAAYAVTTNPDGTVTITLRQFSALPALNRELARDGLPLKAVPVTAHCAFNPAPTFPRGFVPFVPSDRTLGRRLRPTDTITIGTSGLSGKGVVGVIAVGRTASGTLNVFSGGARSPAPSCVNSAAFYFPEVRVTPLPVSRGERESLVAWVRPRPVQRCTITVWDKSGITHAQGLYPKRPVQGRVSWTWTVGAKTNLGKHRVIVSCGSAGALRTLFRVAK
jgi:hypothetical protein